MSDSINVVHDLALLYLEKKELSNISPSEFLDEYMKAYNEIKKHKAENYGSKWSF